MKSSACCLLVVVVVSALALPAFGQVTTGVPPFGSYGGGPFDVVNLGNLNVHFAVPVIHRNGRGTPFFYNFTYDSSIWTLVTSSGVTTWTPVGGWGWQSQTSAVTGYVPPPKKQTSTCTWYDGLGHPHTQTYYIWTYSGFVDPLGTFHYVSLITISNSGQCNEDVSSDTEITNDGSGWTVTVPSGLVTSRSGVGYTVPVGSFSGAGSVTDNNGNRITTTDGVTFYDSLSSQSPVLTISGSVPAVNYTYTSPGGSAKYVMNYSSYNIKTNFGCSGVSEYAANGIYLVSSITLPDQTKYSLTYESTVGSSGYVTGRLATVTLPTGGEIQYGYGDTGTHNTIECVDGSAATLTRALTPGGSWQYTRTGSGTPWTTTLSDPNSNQTVINFSKDSATHNPTHNLYETQRVVSDSTGTLLTTLTCYNTNTTNCSTAQVSSPISQTDVTLEYPNSGQQSKMETKYNTSTGLVTDIFRYAYGPSAPGSLLQHTAITYASLTNNISDHPASVIVDDGTNTLSKTTYSYDETAYALQPTTGTPQHNNPANGSRGNATSIASYSSASANLTRHFYYYDTGGVYKAVDVNGAITTYNFSDATSSCGNTFPTSVTLPITGLSTSTTWNCVGAVATQFTGLNGSSDVGKVTYSDPGYWRPFSVTDQANNVTNFSYTPAGTGTPTSVESSMVFNGTSVSEHLSTLDGFGRVYLSQQQQGYNNNSYDTAQINYDSVGRPYQVSMPFVGTKSQGSSATVTTTSYDALGRVTKTLDAGTGYVSYVYTQNDELQIGGPAPTGENLKQKQMEYDALGRLTKSCAIGNGSTTLCGQQTGSLYGITTSYAYTTSAGSTTVTATRGSQTRSKIFDAMGRMTSQTTPEAGSTTYLYDSVSGSGCGSQNFAGKLLRINFANGNYKCFTYDSLGRTYTADGLVSSGTAGTQYGYCSRFRYDSTANRFLTQPSGSTFTNISGRLMEAETDNCSSGSGLVTYTDEWFSYDKDGHMTDMWELTPHSGTYYHAKAAFFGNGAINTLQLVNPSLYTLTYGIDGEGRWSTLKEGASQSIVSGPTSMYNAAGQPTEIDLTGTDKDLYMYDPNTARMTNWAFHVGSSSETTVLAWSPNRTLKQLAITDGFNSGGTQTCNYNPAAATGTGYDDLGRLVGADCGSGGWGQTFSYDQYSNLTKAVISGRSGLTWNPGYSASNNHYALSGTTYDNSGNVTKDPFHSYTWDGYNKMASVDSSTCGTNGECITYDAMGRAVEISNGSAYTEIWYTQLGKTAYMNGSTINYAYVPAPGGGTALISGNASSFSYLHKDWLGNSRITSDVNAHTVTADQAFAPYGEIYAPFGSTATKYQMFTGDTQDVVAGMMDTPNREYNSAAEGRWLSPDPAGAGWNQYAYTTNPNSFVDPLGLSFMDCTWLGGCAAPCNSLCSGGGGGGAGGGGGSNGYYGGDTPTGGIFMTGALWAIESANENGWYASCVSYDFHCDSSGNYVPPEGTLGTQVITVRCSGTVTAIECLPPSQAVNGSQPYDWNAPVDWSQSLTMLGQMAPAAEQMIGIVAAAPYAIIPSGVACVGSPYGCVAAGLIGIELYNSINPEMEFEPATVPQDTGHTPGEPEGPSGAPEAPPFTGPQPPPGPPLPPLPPVD